MFYQLPHVPVSPIPSIDPLPDLFPEESPTSMSKHPLPPLVSESPPPIYDVSSHASDELPTQIIDVPTDTAPAVTPQKYPRIFFSNFIIYSGYKLSQLGYFPGIVK